MRIPDTTPTAGDILRDALHEAFEFGQGLLHAPQFHHGAACTSLLQALDKAGFEVVPKATPQAPGSGTDALLTDEGERVLAAIARGDLASLSERTVCSTIELVGRLDEASLKLEADEAPRERWAVTSVRPGPTLVGPGDGVWEHSIQTSATAVLTGPDGASREIEVKGALRCDGDEGDVRAAVEVAIRDAMRKAREAAAAFIAATATAPTPEGNAGEAA